jgi:RNA polymerase sigma-70 factor (ECF subfamily)
MSVDGSSAVGAPGEDGAVTPVFGGRAWLCDTEEEQRRTSAAVKRAAAGDNDALQYLYSRYSGNVYRYVRSLVRDSHEAEDVTQQVFLKLMTVLPQYEEAKAPFSGWILRVARNLAIDQLRRRQPVLAEEVFGADASADETGHQCAASLREALAGLPEDWSDLYVELELRSSDHLERAALLLAPVNPARYGGKPGFRFRVARRFGYGASGEMTRRCLERLDQEGIRGSLEILRALSDTDPVATQGPVWYVGGRTV